MTPSNMVGLLLAPERLPACFSFEDPANEGVPGALAPPRRRPIRLRRLSDAVSRALAARAAQSRNRSAAAW